eukprot:4209572-Pyramimonas_sp.AAC.1
MNSDTDSDKFNDGSRTRSGITQDGPKQRKPLERLERATTVEKDAGGRQLSEDSRRSTRDCAGVDRSNGPLVTREGNKREDAHSGGANARPTDRQATNADAPEWRTVEGKRKKEHKEKDAPRFMKK